MNMGKKKNTSNAGHRPADAGEQAPIDSAPEPTGDEAYADARAEALDLIAQIGDLLQDLPAPGNDDHPIHQGHVDTLNEVNHRLGMVLSFLKRADL
jgi:hypothetical protein